MYVLILSSKIVLGIRGGKEMSHTFKVTRNVTEDLIDNNNHMHDAYYNMIFSEVVNEFNYSHGLSLEEREASQYTVLLSRNIQRI